MQCNGSLARGVKPPRQPPTHAPNAARARAYPYHLLAKGPQRTGLSLGASLAGCRSVELRRVFKELDVPCVSGWQISPTHDSTELSVQLMITSSPTGHDIAADATADSTNPFEADLTAPELAWLRRLELRYVTATSAASRAMHVVDSAFCAPTERCRRIADRLRLLSVIPPTRVEAVKIAGRDRAVRPFTGRCWTWPGGSRLG